MKTKWIVVILLTCAGCKCSCPVSPKWVAVQDQYYDPKDQDPRETHLFLTYENGDRCKWYIWLKGNGANKIIGFDTISTRWPSNLNGSLFTDIDSAKERVGELCSNDQP